MRDSMGLNQPPPPYLKYCYPEISKDILQSISLSLMANSAFYNQVLHLMNRMNLDPPFGPKNNKADFCLIKRDIGVQTDQVGFGSDADFELESNLDEKQKISVSYRKRKLDEKHDLLLNKAKKVLQMALQTNTKSFSGEKDKLCETFDANKRLPKKQIALKVDKVKLPFIISTQDVDIKHDHVINEIPEDLGSNRITENQLLQLSVFKNYCKGDPYSKLYIKNLHKDVSENDLRNIYSRFYPELDIKVMQQGRMKGQAFISFVNLAESQLEIVENALIETNGFILKNKPMVVCYGKKQLGLLETIYVEADGPENSTKRQKIQKFMIQPYDYLIAVDFEATCWENIAPPKWRESEIIEFPAVLINLKTGKVEAEFHKYIMPIESPKLSAFCTELTGITQKIVDAGIPLQTALMMFQEWLRKELRLRNLFLPKMSKENKLGNCAFVTWSDWDFGICLAKECQRKRLKKPQFFNQWIDLRAIFREWYNYKPLNFSDALSHVGLEFEGREHSGIDDAKNLASLACKMVNDGASLAITKDLTPFQLSINFGI